MNIDQFVPTLTAFDSIGNEVLSLKRTFRDFGFESRVICASTDQALKDEALHWLRHRPERQDLLFIHYTHSSDLYDRIFELPVKRILVYHNVTPEKYLRGLEDELVRLASRGRDALSRYNKAVALAVADSDFNAGDLRKAGYERIAVLPYQLNEDLYIIAPDAAILRRLDEDGWVNLLCVGRVVPNKCLEDSILVFDYFKKRINQKSRLFIIGHDRGTEGYRARLNRLIARLDLKDVVFTGPVSQAELNAYYTAGHALLCMSEHEGFGVPLVEAMRFRVPVLAFSSSAVAETLRGAGILFIEKRWPLIAEAIEVLLSDPELRRQVVEVQHIQAAYYSREAARNRITELLKDLGVLSTSLPPTGS